MGYDYKALLRDRRWQKKRLEVLEAAGWECEYCGDDESSNQLHVHHKVYRRGAKPWEYENADLAALCERCHDEASRNSKQLDALVAALKKTRPYYMDEAIGYLSAIVADSDTSVATGNTCVSVENGETACGVGSYILSSAQAGSWVVSKLKEGSIDVHAERSAYISTRHCHRALKEDGT